MARHDPTWLLRALSSHFFMRGKTEEMSSCCGRLLEKSALRMTIKKSGIRARPRAER